MYLYTVLIGKPRAFLIGMAYSKWHASLIIKYYININLNNTFATRWKNNIRTKTVLTSYLNILPLTIVHHFVSADRIQERSRNFRNSGTYSAALGAQRAQYLRQMLELNNGTLLNIYIHTRNTIIWPDVTKSLVKTKKYIFRPLLAKANIWLTFYLADSLYRRSGNLVHRHDRQTCEFVLHGTGLSKMSCVCLVGLNCQDK
jgi:hypothetical protein